MSENESVPSVMKLKLLGTGAADYDWSRFGEEGVRGSTSSLLNGHILIDCGATGRANLRRFGIPHSDIDTLLVTHSHDDHFVPEQVAELASGRRVPLAVYASPEALAMLPDDADVAAHPLAPGLKFRAGEFAVTALPANHLTNIPGEQAFHFCFESAAGNLLYALDGAGMLKAAVRLFSQLRFDWVVTDCTMAESGDFRIFEHSDLDMVTHLMKTLRNLKIVDGDTRVVLDHLARTLWPESEAGRQARIAGTGFELAFDGMELCRG